MLTNYAKLATIWAGSPFAVMGRLTQIDQATVITSGNVTSISRTISVKANGKWTTGSPVSISTSQISTLSTANGWTADSVGYNFRDIVPGASLTSPGETRIAYVVTTTDGNNCTFVAEALVKAVAS